MNAGEIREKLETSLEQVAKNDPEAVAAGTDFFASPDSNEDAYIELRNGFLATLSEADRLLAPLRGQFEEYMRTQQ